MAKRTCSMPDCDRVHAAKGLCAKHYKAGHRKKNGRESERKVQVPCTQCGTVIEKAPGNRYRPFCDYACRDLYSIEHGIGAWGRKVKPKATPKARPDLRSPIRRAYEDGDHAGLLAAIKADCEVRPSGCWEWQRKFHASCYATVVIAKRHHQVHRLALEAKIGKPLGKQAAHHVCANTFCVNPDHLQPVTARENTAEMLARTYMESRIADLESALRSVDPTHPLLSEVGVVRQALHRVA